jgi:hypothetical protein
MIRFRTLPLLAVRRMLGNWRLLSSVAVGTLVAAAILSATVIYSDAIRDLGLQFALKQRDPTTLDLLVERDNLTVNASAYQSSNATQDSLAAGALGPAASGSVRQGTSATFFPTSPGRAVDEDDPARPRANLRYRSEIERFVEVTAGVNPQAAPAGAEGPIPAVVGRTTAAINDLAVGDRVDLHPFWNDELPPLEVEIVGLITEVDPLSRYWGGNPFVIDERPRSWETIVFIVPEATFFGAAAQRLPGMTADYDTTYEANIAALNSRNAVNTARAINGLERRLSETEVSSRVSTDLPSVLLTFDEKLFFTRIPLLVLLLQIGGIVAYYLVMVSTMLIERQAGEIATLRSRGATTAQLLFQYGVEGFLLALAAAFLGPPIAATVITALGPTPAFSALSGGSTLDVNISTASYVLAAGGALLAFLSLMIPAWRATRTTVVEFKRATARPRPTPLFLRYYLDVALVLLLAFVFWRLSQQEELFTESLFGETQADPFLLTTPAVFMLTVGIVFLRLFPLVLRVIAWGVAQTRSTAILVGMRSLVRNPTHYTRLVLLLMFATGVGMFGATFSATLDRSYVERAAFLVGADVRGANPTEINQLTNEVFAERAREVRGDTVSPVIRTGASLSANGQQESMQVLAVEPSTFGEVAFFRGDFADIPFDEMITTLQGNDATATRIPIPEGVRQIGVWVRAVDLRGPVTFGLGIRGAQGRGTNLTIGFANPESVQIDGWQLFLADIDRPVTRFGGISRLEQPEPPLTLESLWINPFGRVSQAQGILRFGPVIASFEEPPPPVEGESPAQSAIQLLDAAPDDAIVVADFAAGGWEVISGQSSAPVDDIARTSLEDPPPGFAAATQYQWLTRTLPPAARGLRTATDDQPTLVYLSRDTAANLGLAVGDEADLSIASKFLEVEVAGLLDMFSTLDPTDTRPGFMVASASRLALEANSGTPGLSLRFNEIWVDTSEPLATRADLEALGSSEILDAEQERLAQQEDPLVAAGWAGILAISFAAVLLLSAIGFVVYSYLTAQQRSLEFAILRTLGFSRLQVFSVVMLEQLFVIIAGMGLGTVIGLRIGRLMMDFLGTDERGVEVTPPFVLEVSWAEILLVWGILGAVFIITIAAVVLLYFRLQVHRALRIGDV